ncbi:hypothetical protein [Algoriphagus vanfongensis]|uniref:hypothetical protein n=1 Tax=Algoriphagus vanfongensis TaxID=426371 RepID=UPI000414199E|nr:hypothetical protein [Algoriphagus vanfongensis]
MRKPEQELADIKSMMERSTRFLSLSGLSGVMAGIYALIGSGMAWYWIEGPETLGLASALDHRALMNRLLILALVVLLLALVTGYIFSQKKSQKTANKFWSSAGKRFMSALFIPVLAGGLFSFALLHESYFNLIPATTLIFYGLGLINASHFTISELKNLGLIQLMIGLIAGFFPEIGIYCWAAGFGMAHIIYGAMMYYKYDR